MCSVHECHHLFWPPDTNGQQSLSSNSQVGVAFTEEGMFLLDDVCELTVNQFYTKSVLTFSKLFCHSTLPSLKETGLRQDYDDVEIFQCCVVRCISDDVVRKVIRSS